jgi:hypothetical protein
MAGGERPLAYPKRSDDLSWTQSEHWGCTEYPNANIGTIRTYPARQEGRASTLVLETPTSTRRLEIQTGHHQGEGIVLSHVWLVGKGLDSAVP